MMRLPLLTIISVFTMAGCSHLDRRIAQDATPAQIEPSLIESLNAVRGRACEMSELDFHREHLTAVLNVHFARLNRELSELRQFASERPAVRAGVSLKAATPFRIRSQKLEIKTEMLNRISALQRRIADGSVDARQFVSTVSKSVHPVLSHPSPMGTLLSATTFGKVNGSMAMIISPRDARGTSQSDWSSRCQEFQSLLADSSQSWSDNLNETLALPQMQLILTALNATQAQPIGDLGTLDLSAYYQHPRLQGSTLACTAFATTAEMETYDGVPLLSVHDLYAASQAIEQAVLEDEQEDLEEGARQPTFLERVEGKLQSPQPWTHYEADLDVAISNAETPLLVARRLGVVAERHLPWAVREDRQDTAPIRGRRRFRAQGHVYVGLENLRLDQKKNIIHAMVALGYPPVVLLESDRKQIVEDWYQPITPSRVRHIVNVVGYGIAPSAITGLMTPYFLVRDSLTARRIHYRVDANEFAAIASGIIKTTGVR